MTWRPIKDFENYEISDEGQVRSLPHVTTHRRSDNSVYQCHHKGKVLKPSVDKGGYLIVHLYGEGKNKVLTIHRLVAEAFLDNTDNLPQVNHRNEDKTDNRVDNLEWCTVEYNINYGTRIERISKPVAQYTLSGELIKVWSSINEVGRNGFDDGAVCRCCKGKRNTHKGYQWQYIN